MHRGDADSALSPIEFCVSRPNAPASTARRDLAMAGLFAGAFDGNRSSRIPGAR